MARVQYGGGITEINGTIGGTVFRHTWCGDIASGSAGRVQPPATKAQKIRRKAFKRLWSLFREIATVDFWKAWSAYSYDHPRKNKKGETYYVGWAQSFVGHNINRVIQGNPIHEYPPGYEPP